MTNKMSARMINKNKILAEGKKKNHTHTHKHATILLRIDVLNTFHSSLYKYNIRFCKI